MSNYHDILGVKPGADKDEIKKAYRKAAAKAHPDKGGSDEEFQKVQEAYDRLTHPEKYQEPQGFRWSGSNDPRQRFWDHVEIRRGNGDPIFEEFFKRHQSPRIIKINMALELESTLENQKRTIQVPEHDIPPVEITIPAGIRHGETIKYSNIPSTNDNYTKELLVQFNYLPHKKFAANDIHLITNVEIDAFDAMLGTDVQIETLDGKVLKIKVPAGSQPNTKLKVPHAGLRCRGNINQRGDMYVIVDVRIPKLSEDEVNIINNMREQNK